MKIHLSHIYYYVNRNIYFSHIISKKIIKRLSSILNKHQLYILNENKMIKKLYYIFLNNISDYIIKLNQNKLLVNQLVIQISEYLQLNMLHFYKKEYYKDNTKLKKINIIYSMNFLLNLHIEFLLNKMNIRLFLDKYVIKT